MTDGDSSAKKLRVLFFAVLGVVVLFRLWFASSLPLSGDEAYHWEWSRHLAAGYYDHPPLTAFLIRFSTEVCRVSSELSVRLPAILLLAGVALLGRAHAVRIALRRGASPGPAGRAGFWAGMLLLIVPLFAGTGMYMSTDPPAVFFWMLSLYLLDRALVGGKWPDWILAGVAAGLAVQGKFLAVFFAPAAAVTLLLCPAVRRRLLTPRPYVAALAGLAVCVPCLYWNATHEWATFMFNFVYRHKEAALTLRHLPQSLGGQVAALSPGVWIIAVGSLGWGVREVWRRREAGMTLLVATALCPHAYFVYASLWRRVSIHWPMVGWVPALILVGVAWSETSSGAGPWRVAGRRLSIAVCLFITVGMHALVHMPPKLIRVVLAARDDISPTQAGWAYERFGWDEIGARVEAARNELLDQQGPGQEGVFILCNEYGLAADIGFYTPSQLQTHLWAPRRRHGQNYRFWDDYGAMAGQDAVFVTKHARSTERALPGLRMHFEAVAEPEEVAIRIAGEQVRSFFLVRCRRFDGVRPAFLDGPMR